LSQARKASSQGFPPEALDWLKPRYSTDCRRFAVFLGDGPFFHGDHPGIGGCTVWGHSQWPDAIGVDPTPVMAG
jgi:glutathione S-transferase